LIAELRALAFDGLLRSSKYCGSGSEEGSAGAADLTLLSSFALIAFFI